MRLFDSLLRINHTLLRARWATIVELMVVLAILGLGITALLQTIGWGINYARDTENNIKAINIAREGIEAMTNIRDTNWLRFSSDKTNCWKVKDYQSACIGNSTLLPYPANPGIIAPGSYTIYSTNGAWFLSGAASLNPLSNWTTYKAAYQIWLDPTWFYTQTWVNAWVSCSSSVQKNCKTIFTREIKISIPPPGTQTGILIVQSSARWLDGRPQSVVLETTLTNWRSNF